MAAATLTIHANISTGKLTFHLVGCLYHYKTINTSVK
jgi:hypothetical protein